MSYTFSPKSDEELIDIVPRGVYAFEVLKSERMTSQKGNPMCKLLLKYFDVNGRARLIYDYLVFSDANLNIRKIKHFCHSVGLVEEYKKGELPEDLTNKYGEFEIGIQDEQPNDKGGFYPKKNTVVDYVKPSKKEETKNEEDEFHNDSIPF